MKPYFSFRTFLLYVAIAGMSIGMMTSCGEASEEQQSESVSEMEVEESAASWEDDLRIDENEGQMRFTWVDGVNMRERPAIDAPIVDKLPEQQRLFVTGRRTSDKTTVELRGKEYSDYWYEVGRMPFNAHGWVHGATLKAESPDWKNLTSKEFFGLFPLMKLPHKVNGMDLLKFEPLDRDSIPMVFVEKYVCSAEPQQCFLFDGYDPMSFAYRYGRLALGGGYQGLLFYEYIDMGGGLYMLIFDSEGKYQERKSICGFHEALEGYDFLTIHSDHSLEKIAVSGMFDATGSDVAQGFAMESVVHIVENWNAEKGIYEEAVRENLPLDTEAYLPPPEVAYWRLYGKYEGESFGGASAETWWEFHLDEELSSLKMDQYGDGGQLLDSWLVDRLRFQPDNLDIIDMDNVGPGSVEAPTFQFAAGDGGVYRLAVTPRGEELYDIFEPIEDSEE